MLTEGSRGGPLCLLHFGSFQFLCLSVCYLHEPFAPNNFETTWRCKMEQPSFGPYTTVFIRGRGSGVGGSSPGEQKRDHGHGEGGSSRGERRKYTGRLDVPAKAASSCKAGEALQSLAWTVELLSFCMDTIGSEPSANGDHAEQCLIYKVRTPRTIFFRLGFTRFNS